MFVSRNALMRGFLLNDAGGADGGGTGGGAGGEPPKPLTAADVAQIANSAVTAQLKRSLGPALTEAIGGLKLDEKIAELVGKSAPKLPEGGAGGGEPKPDPRLSALESKYADLDAKYQASEKARVAAETKSRDDSAFASLKDALKDHVRPEMLDVAARDLFLAQRRVSFDESGRPLLTVRKASFQGGEEQDVQLTLQDGAAHWAKTEGKLFAPAPQGGGQGARGQAPSRHVNTGRDGLPVYDTPATTDAEKTRRAAERAEALTRKYPDIT
jgi:hypothetical protein